jgi:hypothetical protein
MFRADYIDNEGAVYFTDEMKDGAFQLTGFTLTDYQDVINYYVGYKPWGVYIHCSTDGD